MNSLFRSGPASIQRDEGLYAELKARVKARKERDSVDSRGRALC